jgi:hypothetical protein
VKVITVSFVLIDTRLFIDKRRYGIAVAACEVKIMAGKIRLSGSVLHIKVNICKN